MADLPLIVDVKRHSLEDGPGIRSVVFFKGCPLRCVFCQNPEAQDPRAEIAFSAADCVACGACADVCASGAVDRESRVRVRRDRCARCGECARVCPGGALRLVGTYYPPEVLAEILLRDTHFYRHSGGGVTLSGGECTLYPDYLQALLRILRGKGVSVVVETCGDFDWAAFEDKVLPYVDLIYYDLKFVDPRAHQKYTGRSNRKILQNFRRLVARGADVRPRVPIVPGVTAAAENLARIVDFLCDAGAAEVSLLPYNPLGFRMAEELGKGRPGLPERFMAAEEEREIYELLRAILAERRRRRRPRPRKGKALEARRRFSPRGVRGGRNVE
jgi:pyruvate formate lyase activating enzyme